jgi:hypothetical protein
MRLQANASIEVTERVAAFSSVYLIGPTILSGAIESFVATDPWESGPRK